MKKVVILFFLMVSSFLFCESVKPVLPRISFEFSTDEGKTYSSEFPVIEKPQVIYVKVKWEIEESPIEAKNNVILTTLYNESTDFASANMGYHTKSQGWPKNGWYQRLSKYWFSFTRERQCIYKLDLRERPAGVMGVNIKWDKDKKRWVSAPLPYCPALKDGTYRFTVRLYYRIKGTGELVSKEEDFFITIRKNYQSVNKGKTKKKDNKQKKGKKIKLSEKKLPELKADYILGTDKISVLEGDKNLKREGEFVVSKSNQEIGWKISGIEKGEYYIQILTQTGYKTGEEEIGKIMPFIFLNGKAIQFDKAGEISPYKRRYVAIIQSETPVYIKNGDEIRWNQARRNVLVGPLLLNKKKLDVAPVLIRKFYDPYLNDYFRINTKFEEINPEEIKFSFEVKNTKGKEGSFYIKVNVMDYFQKEVLNFAKKVKLKNREIYKKDFVFSHGNTDRYRARVSVEDNEGNFKDSEEEILVNNYTAFRKKMWLNKNWEFYSIPDDGTLKTRIIGKPEFTGKEKWERVDLPASWQDISKNKNSHIAWYRKKLIIPNNMRSKKYILHFTRIMHECKVFINRVEAKHHFGPGAFDVDVSNLLKNGENEILIGVRDNISCLSADELKKRKIEFTREKEYIAPYRMRPGIGEVYLYSMEDLIIKDVFIKTYYKNKKIILEITLKNPSSDYILSNEISFKGKKVLEFKDVVPEENKIILSEKWENPITWGPEKFNLLELKTSVKNKNGKLLDCVETRFGFREFYPKGKYIYWNGEKVKFGALPFLSTWGWNLTQRNKRSYIREYIRISKRLSCYMQRHIYDPEYRAEIADEEGIVFAQGTGGVPAGPTIQKLNCDEFWENESRWVKEVIKSLRNHPSIVTWYLSNEFMAASFKKNRERLLSVGKAALEVDDTRIIEFGCDLDLGGLSPIISTHYPVDLRGIREDKAYFPLAAYWRYFGEEFKQGMKIPAGQIKNVANVIGTSPITYGYKPIVINESCWVLFFAPPNGLTKIMGEKVYESPFAVEKAHKQAIKWFVYGHRDVEASVITLWEWVSRNPIQLEIPKYEINILQKYNKFYEGEKITYDLNLHRDVFRNGKVLFKWELKKGNKVFISQKKQINFQSCDLKREKIEIKMPYVRKKEEFLLVLSMEENGEKKCERKFPIYVYPGNKKIEIPSSVKIGIYDEKNYEEIRNIIGTGEKIKIPELSELKKFDILIIGKNSTELKNYNKDIRNYVKDGGKIIVLRQEKNPEFLPFKLVLTDRTPAINFTFRPSHPVLKNISNGELNFWYPEFKTGEKYYYKLTKGNFISIIEAGGLRGLVYSGLIEMPYGKGDFIFSQLFLIENFDKNPVARILLENIINYLFKKETMLKKAGVLGLVDFEMILKKEGVKIDVLEDVSDIFSYETIIIDGRKDFSEEETEILRKFVEKGGRVLIHKIIPEKLDFIRKLTKEEINLYPVSPSAWKGRAIKVKNRGIIEGITNYDLYWRKKPITENYMQPFYSDSFIVAPIGDYIIEGNKGEKILYPNLLMEINQGEGSIILDNLNWDNPKVEKGKRILSTLMTNLNIEIGAPVKKAIPKNLKYIPINIKKFLNRSFKDEVAEDGKGGWTDQGDIDLRSFPTEKAIQIFNGVPFRIEKPLSCLVLSSKFQKPGLPKKVEIPVNMKADVLFFLQSSAWTSQHHHASYIINYEDGTNHEIKLIGGVNLRDWVAKNPEGTFLNEIETITKVAWTGHVKVFGKGSLYMMAWINPYSDKKIKSITFESKNIGVPILVGITAGIKEKKESMSEQILNAENIKKAEFLFKKGKKLWKNKEYQKAEEILKKSVEIYPIEEAMIILGYIYEVKNEWDKAIEIYKEVMKKFPLNLESYYRCGKCYEKKGEYKEAEKIYEKSLKVNQNQPEVIRALEKLKNR